MPSLVVGGANLNVLITIVIHAMWIDLRGWQDAPTVGDAHPLASGRHVTVSIVVFVWDSSIKIYVFGGARMGGHGYDGNVPPPE